MFTKGLLLVAMAFTLNAFAESTNSNLISDRNITNRDKTNELGVGLQVGSFSGVNLEYWLSQNRTVNAAIAVNDGYTAITLATLWMFKDTFSGEASSLVPFIGAGVLSAWGTNNYGNTYFSRRDTDNNSFVAAAQVPLGVEFLPHSQRFGVFAELAPSLEIIPAGFGFITGDVGARLFF